MTAEQLAADARSVRIEDEVTRRGIRLQGRDPDRAGPCPVCGGTDRFGVNIKKQMFYCRKCDVGGDVITFVRHVDGCTFKEAVNLLTGRHTPPQKPATGARHGAAGHRDSGGPAKAADNAATAAWLWGLREPISENCPASLYLRRTRGYHGPIPSTLGYLPANGKHPPAMIAAFGFCEEVEAGVIDPPAIVAGVHITSLTSDGGKAPIDPVKIMLGQSMGLPIVLAPANDLLAIDIVEGIETGLIGVAWRWHLGRRNSWPNAGARGGASVLYRVRAYLRRTRWRFSLCAEGRADRQRT